MKKSIRTITLLVLVMGILTSCRNFPLNGDASDADSVATAVALTVEAVNAQAAQDQQQQPQAQPTNTLPPLPTVTPKPIDVPQQPTNTPLPCNKAMLISESPVDDTKFQKGESFTKTWRVKNIGTCTWNTNYKMAYISGEAMGASTTNLTSSVAPNETVDISLNMTAPSTNGTHKGVWNLLGDDDENFANFWVQIIVESDPFAVTNVSMSADNANFSGPCPHTFNYEADITTNGAGTVSYYVDFSTGPDGPTKSMTYDAAGTKTISGSWILSATGSYWIKVYIDNPNHQLFNPLNLTLTCTP